METTTTSRPMILVGALQGALMWGLWRAAQDGTWPATQPGPGAHSVAS